jgi:hypothetical protein
MVTPGTRGSSIYFIGPAHHQRNYRLQPGGLFTNKDLGFNKEQILFFPMRGDDLFKNRMLLKANY